MLTSAAAVAQKSPPAEANREVVVDRLAATDVGGVMIRLRAVDGSGSIEMVVGLLEGQSIDMARRNQKAPRPMTHDIFKTFLDRNGWTIDRVIVRDLVEGTFLADLVFQKNGQKQTYDARPSDSIALALRAGAKIFVSDKVFELQRKDEERAPGQRRGRVVI